jgi:hypothetical protein
MTKIIFALALTTIVSTAAFATDPQDAFELRSVPAGSTVTVNSSILLPAAISSVAIGKCALNYSPSATVTRDLRAGTKITITEVKSYGYYTTMKFGDKLNIDCNSNGVATLGDLKATLNEAGMTLELAAPVEF